MNETGVCIGIPHLGDLPEYFVLSLLGLNKGVYHVVFAENRPVDLARNEIVEAFLEQPGATHLFFMDADMIFPPEALERLLSLDLDVVSGTYFARTDTPVPHAYRFAYTGDNGMEWYAPLGNEFVSWLKNHPEQGTQPNVGVFGEPDVVECDAVGAGCLLIKREVLEAVYRANSESYYPWFQIRPGTKGGEDFEFCRRAKALGYRVWSDFSVQCNHRASGIFTGREEFVACFGIGTPEAHDFSVPFLVDVGPSADAIRKVVPARVTEPVALEAPRFGERLKSLVGGRK